MKCFNCNKGIAYGHNVSHSKRRTKRIFKPNLHQVRIMVGGNRKNVRLCTKCLRLYKKLEKVQRDNTVSTVEEARLTSQAAV